MYYSHQSHEERAAGFDRAVIVEDHAIAAVIAYLVDVEEDRTHLQLGYSSMRDFCRRRGGWSKSFTDLRLGASRLVQRFPPLLEALRAGKLTLSSMALLRNLFNEENLTELVAIAQTKSKTEVQELVSTIEATASGGAARKLPRATSSASKGADTPPPPTGAAPARSVTYPIQIAASASLQAKIERARSLVENGDSVDLAALVEAAFDLFLAHHEGPSRTTPNMPRDAHDPSADVAAPASTQRKGARSTERPAEAAAPANDTNKTEDARDGTRPPKVGPSKPTAPVRTGSTKARSPAGASPALPRKPLQKATAAGRPASPSLARAAADRGSARQQRAGKGTTAESIAPRRGQARTPSDVREAQRQKRAGNGAYMKPA